MKGTCADPLLYTPRSRDAIPGVAKHLKAASEPPPRACIEEDVHPTGRRETARLKKKERKKEKHENIGIIIKYD